MYSNEPGASGRPPQGPCRPAKDTGFLPTRRRGQAEREVAEQAAGLRLASMTRPLTTVGGMSVIVWSTSDASASSWAREPACGR